MHGLKGRIFWARAAAIGAAVASMVALGLHATHGGDAPILVLCALSAVACIGTLTALLGAQVFAAPAPPQASASPRPLQDLTPLLEALPEPALVVDRQGRIAGSNAAVRRQLQFEASGLRLSALLRHPEVLDGAQAAAMDGLGRSVDYQPAGSVEEHLRVHVSPIVWGGERAALLVFHDQTSLIATERMRADFLTNASHELRTPIAAISLLLETLSGAAKDDPEARERFLGLMATQTDRMRRLVDDLLSLSRIELDEHVPPQDQVPLGPCIKEAMDAVALLAKERRVELRCPDCSLDATVTGDRYQLLQVLQNLIDNAIKYAPEDGVVEIELGVAESREAALERSGRRWPDAGRVALLTPPPGPMRPFAFVRISDNGRGIARRHLPRLTERFYRVDPDARTERVGTGLGLAICKHIMARHRGGFCVESIVGQGAAFAVFLQLSQPVWPGGRGFHQSDTKPS